ncbi:hypothetical protein PFAG_04692 [Plasmodium falciparum Santa Lucia]|uniref:Uncharacterized protein n=1 Tax=Plasmodium falciparum Santa Lucia TaxID=478859 RepID=W7FIS3_PLAFA|nr:hypothetical protein PFAG_04692 [Plasmodium falciparum Santa Lucia]
MDIQRKIKKCITLKRKLKNPKGCLTNLKNKIIKCNVKDFQSTRNRYFFNIFEKIIKRYIFNNVMNTNRTNNFGIENISCTQYDKIKNIPYTCHNIKYDIHSCNNKHIYDNNSYNIIKKNNMDLSSFLKNIIFNINYLLYLFNKNNRIYFDLHVLFKNDLLLQRNINISYESNIDNMSREGVHHKRDILINTQCLYNINDLFALFIFYVHIKRFYFDFFFTILKNINDMESTNDYKNVCYMNNIHKEHIYHIFPHKNYYNIQNMNSEYCLKFLKACIQLKNIISNIVNINKKKKEKNVTNHQNNIRTCRINYFVFIKNAIFKKCKIKKKKKKKKKKNDKQIYIKAYIHNSVYTNIFKDMLLHNIKIERKKKKINNNNKIINNKIINNKIINKNIIELFNNNIIRKKYIHFFFLKKQKYKNMTYHKFKKRKDMNTLIMCDKYINKSICLFLNNFQDSSIFIKYMKIIKKANIINYLYDDHVFIKSLMKCVKKNCAYFTGQDLIFIYKWKTHMNNLDNINQHNNKYKNKHNNNMYIKTDKVKDNNVLFPFSLIKDDIFRHIEDYHFHHIKDIIYICYKNKLYEYKLFHKIINHLINNINKICSKYLVTIIILLYNKLNCKTQLKELLFILLNNYRPSLKQRNKRNNISINNIYLKNINKKYIKKKKKKKKYIYIYTICKKKNNVGNIHKHNVMMTSNHNNILFRSFEYVKVHKLLLFINILIKSNIYINYEWSLYFLSLIKQKHAFIKKKGFYILCYILFHIQNNHIIYKSYEHIFNPYNKYNIYNIYNIIKCTLPQILGTSNIYSLIYVAFLYSTNNTINFIKIFFTIIQKFYDSSMIKQIQNDKNNYQHISCHNYSPKKDNSEYYIPDDHNKLLYNYSYNQLYEKNHFNDDNIFIHDLKIYERNINNKYQKIKDKKKIYAFKNKINLINIPLICNNVKEHFSFNPYVNNIKYQTRTPENISKLMYINNSQEFQNTQKDNFPHILNYSLYTHIKNNPIKKNQTNNLYIKNDYYNQQEKEIDKSCINNKFETINNYYNIYTHNLFNRVHKSRLILILIYHFLFIISSNNLHNNNNNIIYNNINNIQKSNSVNTNFTNIKEDSLLYKIKNKYLFLLYQTYMICISYINMSLKITKNMNNNKNAQSSKMHKQIFSHISELVQNKDKYHMVNEYAHYPYEIDICIKRLITKNK